MKRYFILFLGGVRKGGKGSDDIFSVMSELF